MRKPSWRWWQLPVIWIGGLILIASALAIETWSRGGRFFVLVPYGSWRSAGLWLLDIMRTRPWLALALGWLPLAIVVATLVWLAGGLVRLARAGQ